MEHECEYCHGTFEVYDSEKHERLSWEEFKKRIFVRFTDDPFQSEIRDDWTQHWLCSDCWRQSADEI